MTYKTKISWAFALSVIVSICWIVGDITLVGFEPNPSDYPLFSETYADKVDVELAVHMLEGSTDRLMFGALIGALTAPLLLVAMWLIYQYFIDKSKWYALFNYYILMAGAVLSPLAHASFFYVGENFKAIYQTDKIAHPYLIEVANSSIKMLNITWTLAILVLSMGWIFLFVCILLKKTVLPRWSALFTPFPMIFIILGIKSLLPVPYSGWIGGATFNIAQLTLFLMLLFYRKKLLKRLFNH